MLLFRSEEHVERSEKPHGTLMTTDQAWRSANIWYHDRGDPGWRRRTADEAQSVFTEIGLTGDFWKLR